jgi:hypothetical protein
MYLSEIFVKKTKHKFVGFGQKTQTYFRGLYCTKYDDLVTKSLGRVHPKSGKSSKTRFKVILGSETVLT